MIAALLLCHLLKRLKLHNLLLATFCLRKDAETRLRVLGTPQFFKFLEDSQLFQYAQELAVPQWLPFTSEVADSLMQGCSLLLLPAYARGLFAYPTFPRVVLFFRSLVASCATEKDGHIAVSYRHSPCQIHYIGPQKPENIYLVQLRDTIDILLFKYGGQPVQIHPATARKEEYVAKYSYCTPLIANAETSVIGIAIQHNSSIIIAEVPFTRAFCEVGCALWRLAQCVSAKVDLLQTHGCINNCHSDLARLPLVLVEGHLDNSRLNVCPSTARALFVQEQAEVWAAQDPPALCILFICQTSRQVTQDFYHLVTTVPGEHGALPELPTADYVLSARKDLLQATPIDSCPSLAIANGWYFSIGGEAARTVFWRAQALLNQI